MGGRRQNHQMRLAFMTEGRGEAPSHSGEGTEPSAAKHGTESPASTERLMEEVCERENLRKALKRVKANRGSRGLTG